MKRGPANQGGNPAKTAKTHYSNTPRHATQKPYSEQAIDDALNNDFHLLKKLTANDIIVPAKDALHHFNAIQYSLFVLTKFKKQGRLCVELQQRELLILDCLFEKLSYDEKNHILSTSCGSNYSLLHQAIVTTSEEIVSKLLTILQQTGFEEALRFNLEKINRDGFGILIAAICSGSEKIASNVLALLKQPGFEKVFLHNLEQFTCNNIGVLQVAAMSGSEKIASDVLASLRQPGLEKALRLNFEIFSSEGFGALLSAINSGSEKIFTEHLTVLQQPGFEKALRLNLEQFTNNNFGTLQAAIKLRSEKIVNELLIVLRQPGLEKALRLNLETVSNTGFSVLQAAVSSGSEKIFYDILASLQQPGLEKALRRNLEEITNDDFTVLQSAIKLGSEKIASEVLTLLQQPGFEKALHFNLEKITRDGFGILQAAIKLGSEKIVSEILTLLQQPRFEKALRLNLEKITNFGFSVLQAAINSRSEKIFIEVSILLQQPGFEYACRLNLESFSYDGYGILHSAIRSGSEKIFHGVLAVLQQPRFENKFLQNLEHFANNDFSILQVAVRSGSERMVSDVLTILQQPGCEKALRLNLEKSTRDGFCVFQSAIISGSEQIASNVLTFLQQPGFEKALHFNLEKITRDGFSILQAAIKLGSEKLLRDILTLLQQPGSEKALRLNLETATNAGFSLLQGAINSSSEKIFHEVLDLLQQPGFEKALRFNLALFTKSHFGVLQAAINSNSDEIFQQVLNVLCQPQYRQILTENLLSQNSFGYKTFHSGLAHLSDSNFEYLCKQINSDILTSEQKRKSFELPPAQLAKTLLAAKSEQLGKIKYYFKLLHDELGEKKALDYLNKALNSKVSLPPEMKEKYQQMLTQSVNYHFYSKKELINVLLRAFSGKIYDLSNLPLLQERTLGLQDVTYHDEKGKSLLWCAAQAGAFGHPDFLIKLWNQYHDKLELVDILRREGEKADGMTVLWFMLYACTSQPTNHDLVEIVKEISKRYPAAFELDYLPRSELKTGVSIGVLLKRMGKLGEEITPVAGITAKYLFGQIPTLPQPIIQAPAIEKKPLGFSTCLLKQMVTSEQTNEVMGVNIDVSKGFKATFYSNLCYVELKSKNITFVCAGRKNNAWVPTPEEGVVIWVLTADEYQEVKQIIPETQSVLVINKITHDVMGNFEKLNLITSRRLAIFLFAHFADLKHFVMLDDNVKKLLLKGATNQPESSWDVVYQKVKQLQHNKICVSVQTQTSQHKKVLEGQLGCKFFLINMAKIKEKITKIDEMFSLFPNARDAHKCTEDYFFQMMLEAIFPRQGYEIIAEDQITLVRATTQRNAFLSSVPKQKNQAVAELFSLPDMFEDTTYPLRKSVIQKLNQIIQSNIDRALNQQKEVAQCDLLAVHAKSNQARADNVKALKLSQENVVVNPGKIKPLIKKRASDINNKSDMSTQAGMADNQSLIAFKQFIQDINFIGGNAAHYPHQIEAIKSIAKQNVTSGQIIMATGTGKTRVQCDLARIAYRLAKDGQMIIIVTPQLTLVEQFYRDFVKFAKVKTADIDLSVPTDAIIKVSSLQDSVNVEALLANGRIKKQKCIVIFCEKSFQIFLPHLDQYNPYICLMDEFHEYTEATKQVLNHPVMMVKLGFTATPPRNCFNTTFYRFAIEDALKAKRLAPVVIDKINREFCVDDIESFIEALPVLLNRHHPCAATKNNQARLKELTGVIYLPSIEDCEKAKKYLKAQGIRCYAIHSQNKQSDLEIAHFKGQKAGILLACQMLRVGFDHYSLSFVIIAQAVNNLQTLEQMVGRVMRLDGEKLGNVITFKDIAKKVKEITGLLTENHALNENYRVLKDTECYDKTIFVKKKTLKLRRFNELTSKPEAALPIAQATSTPAKWKTQASL